MERFVLDCVLWNGREERYSKVVGRLFPGRTFGNVDDMFNRLQRMAGMVLWIGWASALISGTTSGDG